MFWTVLLLSLTAYIIYRFLTFDAQYSLPPGPLGFPVLGHIFDVKISRISDFKELARQFGGIFSLKLFGQRIVVVNDSRIIQSARDSKEVAEKLLSHRPSGFLSQIPLLCRTIPYMQPNQKWSSRRQLLTKKIPIYAGGLQLSESLLKQELSHLAEWISSHKEKPVDLSPVVLASLVNTSTILLLGKRFPYEGPEIKAACDVIMLTERLSDPKVDALLCTVPFLSKIPVLWGAAVKNLRTNLKLLTNFYYNDVKNDPNAGASAGLMGLLLKATEGNNNDKMASEFSDDDVMEMVVDVLTTSVPKMHATLMNLIWMTIHKPAVALKVQREVEKVTGSTRLPTLRDRARMPFTEAAILELLRFSSPVPFSKHSAQDDMKLEEYKIPANTTVMFDLRSQNHDENIWENPSKFMPERFLDESGKLIPENNKLRQSLQTFGTGSRNCIGQSFAVSRIFLYVTTLLQQFNFRQPPDDTSTSDCPLVFTGSTAKPAPFQVKIFQHPYKVDFYRQRKS